MLNVVDQNQIKSKKKERNPQVIFLFRVFFYRKVEFVPFEGD